MRFFFYPRKYFGISEGKFSGACFAIRKIRKMQNNIFYITGRGGDYQSGLGEYLNTKTYNLNGLSLTDTFLKKELEIQLDIISKVIIKAEHKKSLFVANSYGAYLLLYTILLREIRLSKLVIISPILGSGYTENRYFKPPFSRHMSALMLKSKHELFKHLVIIWGARDAFINRNAIQKLLATASEVELVMIDEQGHNIDKSKLAMTLDRILR
ncbi:hypothetical protein N9Z60_04890 [Gammaproteobacteria bacterium]|nr:hypothetical protein [Gammaproteobacteria bacterium]